MAPPSSLQTSLLPASTIEELERVVLTEELLAEGYLLPQGARGTVVLRHGRGEAFEVEFTEPFHAVVGVPSDLLKPLRA